jgi:hypothetical protein
MSDATPIPPTPDQPSTPPPAGSTPPAAPAYAPGAPVKQGLSLTAFILGIAAVVFSWVFVFGLLVGIAGLIISVIARKREPQAPNWMKLLGLILSIVGLVIAAIVTIFTIIGFIALASIGYNSY